jgi:hypothetical protein
MTQNKNGSPNRGDPNKSEEPAATGSWRDNLAGAANDRCMYVHSNRLTESRQDCTFLDFCPHFNNLSVDDRELPPLGAAEIQPCLTNHLIYTGDCRHQPLHLKGAAT